MRSFRPLLAALVLMSLPALADKPQQQQSSTRPLVDVAFVLDTTSSMSGLIEGAKQKIWSIASNIARGKPTPALRVALVAYRDRGDAYVVQRFDLTRDLDAVYAHLKTLNAEGGGDTPEHVGRGLGEAVKNLAWSTEPNAMKMIFLVGDAPPQHYQDGWDPEIWAERAHKQGIVLNTIRCGGDVNAENSFRALASLGAGAYASIDGAGGMVAVSTPYDAKLANLNSAIADKTVYGGAAPLREEAEKKAKGMGAMSAGAAADRLSFAHSADEGGVAHAYAPAAPAGAEDLTAKPATVASMPVASLPEPMRAMNKTERVQYLEKVANERSALEKEAAQVASRRDQWIKDHVATKADSFDGEVMKQVKGEGAKHGIAY